MSVPRFAFRVPRWGPAAARGADTTTGSSLEALPADAAPGPRTAPTRPESPPADADRGTPAAPTGREDVPPDAATSVWPALALRIPEPVAVGGLIAAVAWIAQFHHFRDFGLYEDDYWFISEAMGKDPSYLVARFEKVFSTLPQGRPFGFFLPDLLSWIGDRLGGLPGIYLLGFLVVVLNSFLFYRLIRRRVPAVVAAVGGLAFGLFPADTTKFLLIHDFQLQPSLTFVLLASLAYAAGRLPLAYLLSVGSLLAYENGFLAFVGLPLLVRPWDRRTLRELARHVLVVALIVAGVVALRFVVGEGRATNSVGAVSEIVPRLLGSLVIGPVRAVALFLYGPLKAVPTWDAETILLATFSAIALAYLLRGALSASDGRGSGPSGRGLAHLMTDPELRAILEVGMAGALMLVLGYALAFTHYPPNAVIGRGTSVHLGATIGAATLFAAVVWLGQRLLHRDLLVPLLAGYLALAIGYHVTIGRDFVRSWQIQRAFWQQVAACCSDLQNGTVLIYEQDPAGPETSFIATNSWADALVLDETFRFPSTWTTPPRLFSLTNWQTRVQASPDGLIWWVPAATWDEHWEPLPQHNVILLRNVDGGVKRITGTLSLAGGSLALKDPAPAQPSDWPPAQLYDLLLGSPAS